MIDLNAPNEYGVPLHACNGHRQDEHYWRWLRHLRETGRSRVQMILDEIQRKAAA